MLSGFLQIESQLMILLGRLDDVKMLILKRKNRGQILKYDWLLAGIYFSQIPRFAPHIPASEAQ